MRSMAWCKKCCWHDKLAGESILFPLHIVLGGIPLLGEKSIPNEIRIRSKRIGEEGDCNKWRPSITRLGMSYLGINVIFAVKYIKHSENAVNLINSTL